MVLAVCCMLLQACNFTTNRGNGGKDPVDAMDTHAEGYSDAEGTGSDWPATRYEGLLPAADCPGIIFRLCVRQSENGGDGRFSLDLTYLEAEDGKDVSYNVEGRLFTLRGTPENDDAVVWQLVSDGDGGDAYNFLLSADGDSVTLLDAELRTINSGLNYTLERLD